MTNRVTVPIKTAVTIFEAEYVADKSQATADKYSYALELFQLFLDQYYPQLKHWGTIRAEHYEEFLGYFYTRKVLSSNSTEAKSIISALWTFTRWLDRKYGLTAWGQYGRVHGPYARVLPNALQAADLLQVWADAGYLGSRQSYADDDPELEGFWRVAAINGQRVTFHLADEFEVGFEVRLPKKIVDLLEPGVSIFMTLCRDGRSKEDLRISLVGSVVLG